MINNPEGWASIRARYELAQENVAQIAADLAMSPYKLTLRARAEGWLLRSKPKKKSQSTRDTIKRLKELLQNRLAHLETQIGEIGEEISALASERDIRATNTLVRTLEKVLELEHKDRKHRSQRARATRKFNDAERDELAQRIVGLCKKPNTKDIMPTSGAMASSSAAEGLADLGTA
jgi:hypothetical protein